MSFFSCDALVEPNHGHVLVAMPPSIAYLQYLLSKVAGSAPVRRGSALSRANRSGQSFMATLAPSSPTFSVRAIVAAVGTDPSHVNVRGRVALRMFEQQFQRMAMYASSTQFR
jgi:hypothetical protein